VRSLRVEQKNDGLSLENVWKKNSMIFRAKEGIYNIIKFT
jgi:hypothetical protein